MIGVDPDGQVTGAASDDEDTQWFVVYPNGRLSTWGEWYGDMSEDADWFKWN